MKNNLLLSQNNTTFTSMPEGSEGFVLSELYHTHSSDIIHVVRDDGHMATMLETLQFFAPSIPVLSLPAWDCLPYDRVSPNNKVVRKRIETLYQLVSEESSCKRVILTTAASLLQRVPPRVMLKNAVLHARIGQPLCHDELVRFLVNNGYTRTGSVNEPGEFAVRGSIIDVFSSHEEEALNGLRLDFFGKTLESIRMFDPLTQISGKKLETFTLLPANEVILTEATIQHFRKSYRSLFGVSGNSDDMLYDAISEGRKYVGMEHWLPLFYSHTDSLFDYIPNSIITYQHLAQEALHERLALIADYYQARKDAETKPVGETAIYHPIPQALLYLTKEEWEHETITRKTAQFYPFKLAGTAVTDAIIPLPIRPVRNFAADSNSDNSSVLELLKKHIQENRTSNAKHRLKNPKILLSCYSTGSRDRLQRMLQAHDMHCMLIDAWKDYSSISGKTIGLIILGLESGFETADFSIISEQDLLGERILRPIKSRKRMENFLKEATSLLPGELIVHKEHGIGRFEGLETLTVSGVAHDCLRILYDGGDKLYVPVENIDTISRYGNDDEGGKLDKLGSASWQSRKARLRQRIKIAAEALLAIAAERALKSGTIVTPLKGLYNEFCARFPYAETEDQLAAIEDVQNDLASGKPMDRLICGDVGFGKTEVALRAAFMAVLSEEHHAPGARLQVAVIAPTTLLSRQHYATFTKRFAGFPVRIRQLSRLVSAKEAAETHRLLEEGEIDIVIGTHAVLSKTIRFKNLGLLIVDEEQHFGVAQKEHLKQLKADIHVLTLSATPIPRTLQMSLVGIRELSLIATPPVDRLAVRTFVMPFDPVVIREAILREHYRGGRSFYVCPRIKDMAEVEKMLRALVPEIKLVTAHGQMAASELDDIMNAFYDGKYDLLLSTTIVESGLDVPSANTIILHRSDILGLSQLYQLRGRVGRGKTRAYAYLTLPARKVPSKMALKRLEVMEKLDSLGAGFSLASHDMDNRGFGNLVGDEQSGHIREVGIELYQEMLQEAVETAKLAHLNAEATLEKDRWSPQINIGLAVQIPEHYVPDLSLRLGLYRRVAELTTEAQVEAFAAEMIDRFGPLPEEAKHLLDIVRIKQLCLEAGIEKIDTGPKGAVITFRNNHFAKPDRLIDFITRNPHNTKIRADQKLLLIESWENSTKRVMGVNKILKNIVNLAA